MTWGSVNCSPKRTAKLAIQNSFAIGEKGSLSVGGISLVPLRLLLSVSPTPPPPPRRPSFTIFLATHTVVATFNTVLGT